MRAKAVERTVQRICQMNYKWYELLTHLQKMNERGEALEALEAKFSDLSAGTGEFLKKIKDYNEQQVK